MRPADLLLPLVVLLVAAAPARAETPLSAIDWLRQPPPISVAQPLVRPLGQAPGGGAPVPDVTMIPLGSATPDAVGLLAPATTGLPPDLWTASAGATLVAQMARLGGQPLPAVQALYYTLLLAEADPPADTAGDARFLHARIAALRRFGAVDAALALVERAGPDSAMLFDDWLALALLAGVEDGPCALLAARPDLSGSYADRIFCTARAGDWATAAVTYDAATALGVLDPREAALLGGFLDSELAGGTTSDMAPPRVMTPLLFRLYEAAGTPLPTGNLAREYAVADLRGTMGWKAEIEAAERLARTGALPANQLLGIYTDRAPAASGGVWERVRAIHAFDTAMQSDDDARIAAALPAAWGLMRENGLAVAFAALYGPGLAGRDLPDAARLAWEVALLAPAGTHAAPPPAPAQTRRLRFLDTLARGAPDPALAETPAERAIAAGFAATAPAGDHAGMLAEGRLGQAILSAAALLQDIRPGQSRQIEAALSTLRAVGLADVARAAALQILLLGGG